MASDPGSQLFPQGAIVLSFPFFLSSSPLFICFAFPFSFPPRWRFVFFGLSETKVTLFFVVVGANTRWGGAGRGKGAQEFPSSLFVFLRFPSGEMLRLRPLTTAASIFRVYLSSWRVRRAEEDAEKEEKTQ